MNDILDIRSISEMHQLLNIEKPAHPLISIVRHTKDMNLNFGNDVRLNNHLYFISLKENIQGKFKYGRASYDYQEGSLVFMRPKQITSKTTETEPDLGGWSIFFHPDLIRPYALVDAIDKYTFFDYDSNEALHISEKEKYALAEIIKKIETELQQNIDKHTEELIVHNIESLLKYSQRYFDRQFITRKNHHKDYVILFEKYLNAYFGSDLPLEKGIPSVDDCGEHLKMSGKYLSDLLKKETGKSITERIHLHIVDKAKNKLLSSQDPISQIAFSLGFEYPQHFSKIFKSNAGVSPKQFRNLN
jgi:AraC-like DNA-binding protein